ncbi:NAD-dependent epimerase/dehydratase family protein [Staphylococcus agnetis]|uniref:NAD-dependent epimerase/dehydratase family protein n=1 Tax=Staphylococcus agnetis TaxID=985762 RepID=UPI00142FCB2A|nr:NAD(P)-dependent oxidoreductase [Staphylococcus agnetis]NJH86282.1 NAD-dependent epimerase/dehydratase family protein [Staphylococcus agnetis]NJI15970.1 NAD-dependent epimerase/dehydratase family protein [Staphylococcus agnetis]
MSKNILVLGANGYIGSKLVPSLLYSGHTVTILARKKSKLNFKNINNNLKIYITHNYELKESYFKDIDIVIDLVSFRKFSSNIVKKYSLDEDHMRRIIFAKKNKVKRYIFSSSCSIYYHHDSLSNLKSNNAENFYTCKKLKIERDFLQFNESEFKVLIMRIPTVFGYSPNIRFDLFLNFLILSGLKYNKISPPNINFTRPYIYIDDLINIFLEIISSYKSTLNNGIINIGFSKNNISSNELILLVSEALSLEVSKITYHETDLRSYHVSFATFENSTNIHINHTFKENIIKTANDFLNVLIYHPNLPIKFDDYKNYCFSKENYKHTKNIFNKINGNRNYINS